MQWTKSGHRYQKKQKSAWRGIREKLNLEKLHPCGNETLNNVCLSTSVGLSLIDDDDDDDEDDDDDVEAERTRGEDDDKGTEIMTAMADDD